MVVDNIGRASEPEIWEGHLRTCPCTLVEFLQICVLLGYCTIVGSEPADRAQRWFVEA